MSVEALGYALADTLYRRQAAVLGDEKLHEAGERLAKHLARRGYRVVFDPGLDYALSDGEPYPIPRLEPKPLPKEAQVRQAVLLSIDDEDLRCLVCGCWTFYVEEDIATCSNCRQSHRIRR